VHDAEALGRKFDAEQSVAAVSTDMGNLSHVIPSIHPCVGIDSLPAVNHRREFAESCVSEAADRALMAGALALAWTVIDVAGDKETREHFMRGHGRA
jgi:hypothetical protein